MDEADKLCDRIAVVDHGKLAELDTPARLKDSVCGACDAEAEFIGAPMNWIKELQRLTQAASVTQRDGIVHIASDNDPVTVAALMELARARGVTVRRASVQNNTLDDVFLHYTGRELRDAARGGAGYDITPLYR
jgi:ABC-2 type transport system ATP-binding protein